MIRLTRQQVREIDRLATERYLIPSIVLMENAARSATESACEMLGDPRSKNILLLCGGGNNGGDGLAIARHLHNHGAIVLIALTISPEDYKADAQTNFKIIQQMKLPMVAADAAKIAASSPDLIIDAIFGTGLNRPPRDPFPDIAATVKSLGKPVLAIDLPSGLDCDTGEPPGSCIEATRTITFVAEKIGFANPAARKYLGQISIGDIGCPREMIEQVLRPVPSPGTPAAAEIAGWKG